METRVSDISKLNVIYLINNIYIPASRNHFADSTKPSILRAIAHRTKETLIREMKLNTYVEGKSLTYACVANIKADPLYRKPPLHLVIEWKKALDFIIGLDSQPPEDRAAASSLREEMILHEKLVKLYDMYRRRATTAELKEKIGIKIIDLAEKLRVIPQITGEE